MGPLKISQRLMALWLLIALVLTGCGVVSGSTQARVAATATPAVLADCFQSATAVAWLDADGDGIWDEAEQPLEGIEFVLEPTVYSRTRSDENGIADIFATTPGGNCPGPLQVIAVDFTGYEPTTPTVVDDVSPDEQYTFGFQPIPEVNSPNPPSPDPNSTPAPILVETDAYEGVILTAEAAAEYNTFLGESADSLWLPTATDVTELEKGLVAFLQENETAARSGRPPLWERLSDYKRQYFGFEHEGQRFIFANFFCDEMGTDWQNTPVIVSDGGDCYFQVKYNADTKTFTSISINGEA